MSTIPDSRLESSRDPNWNLQTVKTWRQEQAQHMPNANTLMVLVYLCDHAFYRASNPEDAPIGQVYQEASWHEAICEGTCLSRSSVYRALTWLQDHAFILRHERLGGSKFHQSEHRQSQTITVLLGSEYERFRERARDGQPIPQITVFRPTASPRVEKPIAEPIPMRLVVSK